MKRSSKNNMYAAAFLLSFAAAWLILLINGRISGDGLKVQGGDALNLYLPFIRNFLDALSGRSSAFFSFSMFFGSSTAAGHMLYSLSPLNLLYLIPFFDDLFTSYLIFTLLTGLAALSMSVYIKKALGGSDNAALFFALAYSLSGSMITLADNWVYMDAAYLLPLVLLCLHRLGNNKKAVPVLALLYALLLLSGLRCGCIALLFSILLFPGICLRNDAKIPLSISRFILALLCGTGLSAPLLIPALRDYSSSGMPEGASLPDILSAFFMGEMPSSVSPMPLLYCSLAVLLMLPCFFFGKKEKLSVKICFSLTALLYISASLIPALKKVLDPFYDISVPCAYSFCVVFLLCHMAASSFDINETDLKNSVIYAGIISLIYGFCIPVRTAAGTASGSNTLWLLSALFITGWILLLFLAKKDRLKGAFRITPIIFLLAELIVNSHFLYIHTRTSKTGSDTWLRASQTQAAFADMLTANDPGFYRIKTDNVYSVNEPLRDNYPGFFSSMPIADNAVLKALTALGLGGNSHELFAHGDDPFTDMLFSCRYSVDTGALSVSANETALPIGFMVSADIEDYTAGESPFENRSALISSMIGTRLDLYQPADEDNVLINSENLEHYAFNYGEKFVQHADAYPSVSLNLALPHIDGYDAFFWLRNHSEPEQDALKRNTDKTGYFKDLAITNCILKGHTVSGDDYGIDTYVDEISSSAKGSGQIQHFDSCEFAYMNSSLIPLISEDLSSLPFIVDSHDKDSISGHVTSTAKRPVLFLTLPYRTFGLDVYVDGTKAAVYKCADAFIGLPLAPGEHSISISYYEPSLAAGLLILGISLIVLLICTIKGNKK